MDQKAVKGILIGYDHNDGYRIWCEENKLIRSRDVVFEEKTLVQKTGVDIPVNVDLPDQELQDSGTQTENQDSETEEEEEEEYWDVDEDSKEETQETTSKNDLQKSNETTGRQLRDRSTLKCPKKFEDYIHYVSAAFQEPETYTEAIKSDQQDNWKEAMDQEMKALRENKTCTLMDLPPGKRAIPCKWVYRVKTNADGSVDKFKARLVIKGFSQQKGVDFDQTFSPVARTSTIRTLLSVAANEDVS